MEATQPKAKPQFKLSLEMLNQTNQGADSNI
jgi:hypothetical protein